MASETTDTGFRLSAEDIERAASDGVIGQQDAERLIAWGYKHRFEFTSFDPPRSEPVERPKGLNVVMVAYYLGAMLMISACAWFLGDKWEFLGPSGVLTTALIYALAAAGAGWWIRNKGYFVGGGLLITVAVCLVPLIVYSIQRLAGFWPAGDPGSYSDNYPKVHGSLIVMELATIAAAAFALWRIRFGFLTAPLAISFWFMSMNIAALILGDERMAGDTRQWISVLVGAVTMVVGFALSQIFAEKPESRSEDFAFWCYLFGLMAFWGGLTMMDGDSELKRAGYAAINIALIAVSIKLRRTVFLVFGAVGVHIYLGHLAYQVFQDSFFFPFAIAFLGFSLIIVTILAQRFLLNRDVS